LALAIACGCWLAPAAAAAAEPTVDPSATRPVIKVSGPGPLNFSDLRFNLYAADLGSTFEYQHRLYMVFGDSFGRPRSADLERFAQERRSDPTRYTDWRSNTMASLADVDPAIGPLFAGMITDPANPLEARELLPSAKQTCTGTEAFCEQTVIPTNGFAVGDRMFLHYMSVKRFGYPRPQDYDLNLSGIAFSDDGGHTWTKDGSTTWAGDSNFGQVAATRTGGDVYLFGIPGGRTGDVKLARVREDRVLNRPSYRYWDGRGWTHREGSAAVVASGPAGELSVQWNSYFGKWLMMYLRVDPPAATSSTGSIVLRTADCLTGPWGAPQTVVTSSQYPSLYAPFIPPRWNDGPDVYFTMSIFLTYNVWWMHTALTGTPRPGLRPCVAAR